MLPTFCLPAARRAGTALVCLAALACARAPRSHFVPLAAAQLASVLPLPRPPGAQVRDYVADGRLTALGDGGRLRAPLRLVVRRPDLLRLSVLSPQGSAAFVLASNGETLTSLDIGSGQFREVAADRAGLRALAPQFAFDLSPQALVSLLFGEVNPPDHAAVSSNAEALRFAWTDGDVAFRADFARDDGRLLCFIGARVPAAAAAAGAAGAAGTTGVTGAAASGAAGSSDVAEVRAEVQRWSPEGLPTRLLLQGWASAAAGGRPAKAPAHVLELDLDRVSVAPSVRDNAFTVRP